MPTCAMRPGLQEIGRGHAGAGRLEAKTGKALEDDAGEIVPVADEIGEDADEQRLLGQPGNDVLVSGPAPEYRASVMSIAASVVARKATSPPSRPKPESI